jgi:hypothetical protein
MKRILVCILLVVLGFLLWFSLHLAGTKIYHVDECQNIFTARLLASGQGKMSNVGSGLFQFLPLSILARGAVKSTDLFASGRFLMWEIFWLNLVLIAVATGERLLSSRGLVALAAAATLPLWDYGFEIRHDNLILTGLLVMWCALRVRPAGLQSYFLAGTIAVVLQFVAFKPFVYTIPISAAVLAFPPPGCNHPRWKLVVSWLLGGVTAILVVRCAYGAAGLWDDYLWGLRHASFDLSGARFSPWRTLARLLPQAPLLLALAASALIAVAVDLKRRGKVALGWEGNLPETLLFLIAFGALVINPVPFPYNLLNLVPFAFLLAFRHGAAMVKEFDGRSALVPLAGTLLLFGHFVPFGLAAQRHLAMTNTHQEVLMRYAEQVTDPVKDPVYDGIGLVPTRSSISARWFLHSLNIKGFIRGGSQQVRDMLAAKPAAVIIPNYRTDWLQAEDHAFIREHYVSVADDLWVLGNILPSTGGSFDILHPGRYRICKLDASNLAHTYPDGLKGYLSPEKDGKVTGVIDDVPVTTEVVELSAGTHRLDAAEGSQIAVVWVGPHLNRLRRLPPCDHRDLFYTWY